MIERIIENWLDKANERSFQIPFCQSLAYEGYKVIHLTRHAALEMGKDILAISPENVPCAFQLKGIKGKRMTLSEWNNDIANQLQPLAINKISSTYIESKLHHQSYIVINGDINEEVAVALQQYNQTLTDNFNGTITPIKIILKGELLDKFKKLQTNLWPIELENIKTFLEIYLENGKGILQKDKLSEIILNSLPLNEDEVKKSVCLRSMASASLICSSAIVEYSLNDNHFSEFEAWVIYLASILALCEKNNIQPSEVENELDIAIMAIYNSLERLCDELINRNDFLEGNTDDIPLLPVRMTCLIGLMSIYGMWRKIDGFDEDKHDKFIQEFTKNYETKFYLWGEYALPQILSYIFYLKATEVSDRSDILLSKILNTIFSIDRRNSQIPFPNPYYNVDDIFDHILGIAKEPLDDNFEYHSFAIEGILNLFVRTNRKQRIRTIWPDYTRFSIREFVPTNKWEYYFWRCNDGIEQTRLIKSNQTWEELKKESYESEGNNIPNLIKNYPLLYLCFLFVYPHRINSSGIRWLDSKLTK